MTIAEDIRSRLSHFTPQERRVARALLADYPRAGLGSAADLAAVAGVSAPTVVRFARALGCAGYPTLQELLLNELSERQASPISRYSHASSTDAWFSDSLQTTVEAIHQSLSMIPHTEFETAVERLANPRKRVTVIGGRYSGFVADYFTMHLQQIRPKVRRHDEAMTMGNSESIDMGRDDIAVVYDFRRYQRTTVERAQRLSAAGARIICITDEWLSPVAQIAEVVLPASVRSVSPFDSTSAAFVLTELLIEGVLLRLGENALMRMKRWEIAGRAEVLD